MTDKGIRPYMCSVCGAPGYAKGLCERDYARARRGLSPTPHALRVTTVEQAFARYARPVPSGCIEWSGSRDSGGYGTVSVNGSNRKAHRIALERAGFTVPDNAFVLHSCDNPPCVNPSHLRVGSGVENAKDMTERGRQARGFKNARRRLTDADVLTIQTSTESAASLSERFDVSRQHIYKLRAGKQVPWRSAIGAIHPDDTEARA